MANFYNDLNLVYGAVARNSHSHLLTAQSVIIIDITGV